MFFPTSDFATPDTLRSPIELAKLHSSPWFDDDTIGEDNTVIIRPLEESPLASSFSSKVRRFVQSYLGRIDELHAVVNSSLDQFRFTLVASNQMRESTQRQDSKSINNIHHNSYTRQTHSNVIHPNTTFSLNVRQIPYYQLIHSLRAPLLAVMLLHYAHTSHYRKACVLLAMSILNSQLKAQRIAIEVYLRLANNKLTSFLDENDQLDTVIRSQLRLLKSSTLRNQNAALRHMFGSKWTRKRQRLRTSGYLLRSMLQMLLLSLNDRLNTIVPLLGDLGMLQRFLQVYQIDLTADEFHFLAALNRPDSSSESARTNRLRPLRLRSMSGADFQTNSFVRSPRSPRVPAPAPPPTPASVPNAALLFKRLQLLRKVFLCCVLCLIEPIEEPHSDLFFYSCLRKFNLDKSDARYVTQAGRVFVCIRLLESACRLVQCVCQELQTSQLAAGVDYLEEFEEADTIEEEAGSPSPVQQLAGILDQLSTEMGMLEDQSPEEVQRHLQSMRGDIDRVLGLYNSVSDSSCTSPVSPVPPPMHSRTSSSVRHSSGLSFGLVMVGNEESADYSGDEDERDKVKNRTQTLQKLGGKHSSGMGISTSQ